MSEHKEALWTNYMPILKPDTQVLNSLVDSVSGISPAGAAGIGVSGAGATAAAAGRTSSGGSVGRISNGGGGGVMGSSGTFANLDPSRGADAASAAILAISGSIANTLLTGNGSIGEAAEGLFSLGSGSGGGMANGASAIHPSSVTSAPPPLETVSMVNNGILKSHFLEMTTNFLAPYGPYLRASAPPEGVSPFCDPPPLPAFDATDFLGQLAARGPGKFLSKRVQPGSSWLELYRRFMEGPNFMPWFRRRRAVAEAEQHRLWREARLGADAGRWLDRMSEGDVMEAYVCVEKHLASEIKVRGGQG